MSHSITPVPSEQYSNSGHPTDVGQGRDQRSEKDDTV
jgi:hypothetical protein